MTKIEKACLAFVKAVAADRFATAADAKKAMDAFDPERIYALHEMVDAFLLADLWDSAEGEDEEEDLEDEDEDFEDEDEDEDTAPVVQIRKKSAKKAAKKAR